MGTIKIPEREVKVGKVRVLINTDGTWDVEISEDTPSAYIAVFANPRMPEMAARVLVREALGI